MPSSTALQRAFRYGEHVMYAGSSQHAAWTTRCRAVYRRTRVRAANADVLLFVATQPWRHTGGSVGGGGNINHIQVWRRSSYFRSGQLGFNRLLFFQNSFVNCISSAEQYFHSFWLVQLQLVKISLSIMFSSLPLIISLLSLLLFHFSIILSTLRQHHGCPEPFLAFLSSVFYQSFVGISVIVG